MIETGSKTIFPINKGPKVETPVKFIVLLILFALPYIALKEPETYCNAPILLLLKLLKLAPSKPGPHSNKAS
jgi:hypothetical protein